jgi:branched-chain amino acid transport system ATP-binding protein
LAVLLETRGLAMTFGGLRAVSNLNLSVEDGSLVGLIGPNGAGKTTVFNMISGLLHPSEGTIVLAGQDITRLPAHAVTRMGLARTFQNIRLFENRSVLENVMIAQHRHVGYGFLQALLHLGIAEEEARITESSLELLRILELEDKADQMAGNLPYGEQRLVEIARALATRPRLLLLDEPAAGMNPNETAQLMEFIQRIRQEFAVTILLIEHDMNLVMGICEHITVLDYGMTIAEGTPAQVRSDRRVIKAYLGEEAI